jgi:hypothetical protein
LRPLFAGRLPTEAEVRKLGTRYDREPREINWPTEFTTRPWGMVKRLAEGVYLVMMVTKDIKLGGGILRWAMPLGDGWSIGVTEGGAQVGLFKEAPPAADAPVEPHPDF